MIRQSLIIASALIAMLIAGVLTGCEKEGSESTPPSSASAPSESDMQADQEMDMQAGENLHGNFVHKELVVLDDPVEVPTEFTTALGQMYQHYRQIARALVGDDSEAADEAAQRMREHVEDLVAEELDAEAEGAWQSHRTGLRTGLHQLTSAESIEDKRGHFSHVSEAMYCALKSFGGVDEEVFVAYCPMAAGGHGAYWLADQPTIENPYMGQEMVACGEVKETIRGRSQDDGN
ncbi:MAG: DUF3347 domain-containing protein [Bradymonadaceae bacterium]